MMSKRLQYFRLNKENSFRIMKYYFLILFIFTFSVNYAQTPDEWFEEWDETIYQWGDNIAYRWADDFANDSTEESRDSAFNEFVEVSVDIMIDAANERFNDALMKAIFLDNFLVAYDQFEYRAWLAHKISFYSFNCNNYQYALSYALEAVERCHTLKSLKPNDKYIDYLYCISQLQLAVVYFQLRDFKKTHQSIRSCLELCKGIAGWEYAYFEALNTEALCYSSEGFNEKALEIEKEVITLVPFTLAPLLLDRFQTNYIYLLFKSGRKNEAIIALEDLLTNKKQAGKNTSIEYADLLHARAVFYESENVDKSISLLQDAMNIYISNGVIKSFNYAQILSDLAYYQASKNLYQEALETEKRAYDIFSFIAPENNPKRLTSLMHLSAWQYYTKHWKEAEANIIQLTKVNDENIKYSLLSDEKTRSHIWKGSRNWYMSSIPIFAYHIKTDSLNITAYNSALFSKGILLHTDRTLKYINDRNPQIVKRYYEWQNLKKQLSELQSIEQYETLKKQVADAEGAYYNSVYSSQDFQRMMNTKWNDVQTKLGSKDIAMEFVSFKDDDNLTKYFALVLKKDLACPALVPLFNEPQLPSTKEAYTGHELANLVWKPMEKYLEGVENIYFSASGQLHVYAIENAKHWDEEVYMCDKYNIHRLSSTRELVLDNPSVPIKRALVFGGVKYEVPLDTLIADVRKYPIKKDTTMSDFALKKGYSRSGLSELPFAQVEVKKIDSLLTKNGVKSTLKEAFKATEEAFKSEAEDNMNIIHLATHGSYYREEMAKMLSNLPSNNFLSINGLDMDNQEDEERTTLSRSCLMLAGADTQNKPNDIEDGILTAYEISQLNLQQVDLAVLAACQSGLGDILGDEVFGLQRGLKKAGVSSILVSLCSVNDMQTMYLMTEFYVNLISRKMGKADALKAAKESTRAKFKDSDTWANFILIDAIN